MMTPGMDEGQLELAGLIHDLRNPLTAIRGRAQLLRHMLDGRGDGRGQHVPPRTVRLRSGRS
jgi:nitrogen-specific signal transduction histidine kinase